MLANPLVSVVMAVKDGEDYVREAVDSILNQTYQNFEFIIINDGSQDATVEILEKYSDPRIKILHQENCGLAKSLNRGLKEARGKYIARQDHDDISLPDRLVKQVHFLEKNPQCGLLGTAAEIWPASGAIGRSHNHPCSSGQLEFELLFNNPFVHTSWMFRKAIIEEVGLYSTDPFREPPEDYEYISRISRVFNVANLSERLVIYREIPKSISSVIRGFDNAGRKDFINKLAIISGENIAFANNEIFSNKFLAIGGLVHFYKSDLLKSVGIAFIVGKLMHASVKIAIKWRSPKIIYMAFKKLPKLIYFYNINN